MLILCASEQRTKIGVEQPHIHQRHPHQGKRGFLYNSVVFSRHYTGVTPEAALVISLKGFYRIIGGLFIFWGVSDVLLTGNVFLSG